MEDSSILKSSHEAYGIELTARMYNIVIGLLVSYGLIVNAVLCVMFPDVLKDISPFLFLIAYFVSCFIGIFMNKAQSNILKFIGYNLIVLPIGLLLTTVVPGEDVGLVINTVITTGAITVLMTVVAGLLGDRLANLGPMLFTALFCSIIVELLLILFGLSTAFMDILVAGIFTLYIAFDWWKAHQYDYTLGNAISCSTELYLDIINLFIRLLASRSNDD